MVVGAPDFDHPLKPRPRIDSANNRVGRKVGRLPLERMTTRSSSSATCSWPSSSWSAGPNQNVPSLSFR